MKQSRFRPVKSLGDEKKRCRQNQRGLAQSLGRFGPRSNQLNPHPFSQESHLAQVITEDDAGP